MALHFRGGATPIQITLSGYFDLVRDSTNTVQGMSILFSIDYNDHATESQRKTWNRLLYPPFVSIVHTHASSEHILEPPSQNELGFSVELYIPECSDMEVYVNNAFSIYKDYVDKLGQFGDLERTSRTQKKEQSSIEYMTTWKHVANPTPPVVKHVKPRSEFFTQWIKQQEKRRGKISKLKHSQKNPSPLSKSSKV